MLLAPRQRCLVHLNTTTYSAAKAFSQPSTSRSFRSSIRRHSNSELDDAGIAELLSKSTWSANSLLPTHSSDAEPEVTSQQLRRLLRLSALQAPVNSEQEAKMLAELHAQLHFVRNVQSADTQDVQPLQRISDESQEAQARNEVSLASMKAVLDAEVVSKGRRRPVRRKNVAASAPEAEQWDPLAQAPKRFGRFFVVDRADG